MGDRERKRGKERDYIIKNRKRDQMIKKRDCLVTNTVC